MLLPLTVLALLWRAPAAYRRRRGLFIFAAHVLITRTRAALTAQMKAQAIVGSNGARSWPVDDRETPGRFMFRRARDPARGELRAARACGLRGPRLQPGAG